MKLLNKQEVEVKRKAVQEEEMKSKMKKDWAMETRFGLEKQIKSKNDGSQALAAQHRYDEDNIRTIERELNDLNNMTKAEKKARQQKYKEMLDNQAKTREHMRMYGNMTGIEKQMNKNDLTAFKNYDTKTYALIPGLNSLSVAPSKKVLEDKMHKKRDRSYDEQLERMNQFGLTRDVTLIKNPGMVSTNAHRSSVDNITGHVYNSARGPEQNGAIRGVANTADSKPKAPFSDPSMPTHNFNNHHLYQMYNPINGSYSPDRQSMNQARTTFRFAANNIMK